MSSAAQWPHHLSRPMKDWTWQTMTLKKPFLPLATFVRRFVTAMRKELLHFLNLIIWISDNLKVYLLSPAVFFTDMGSLWVIYYSVV